MASVKAGTRPPWVGLGAAVWVQVASGNANTFPLYSHSLKSVLGFNQKQLTLLGVANDIGENVGILPGIASNKFQPWVVLMIGGLCCFFGYGVLWLSVSGTVQNIPYWLLCIALCIGPNSAAWLTTAVLVTNMRNFPLSRGTVVGILKGYGGISGAVFTEIYGVMLRSSSSALLLFLSVGVPILCFMVMYLVRPCTPASGEDSTEPGHFLFIQVTSFVLGVYVLATTILDHIFSLTPLVSNLVVVGMILLLLAPLLIPVKMTLYPSRRKTAGSFDQRVGSSETLSQGEGNESDKAEPLLVASSSNQGSFYDSSDVSEVDMLLAVGEGAVKPKRRPKRGEDFKFSEAIVKADFWLLFFAYFTGVGSGVTVLNNLAQIGIAQGLHDTTILVSLFSFGNFLGRLGGGVVSEHFVRSRTVPRTAWMACTQIIMVIAYLMFASALNGTLFAATAMLGICYGTQFSVMIPTVSELFGLKHFGLLCNWMSLGNPLGALLFSNLLSAYIYDNETAKQHGHSSSTACLGPNCFRVTFYVLASVCGAGTILSIILTMRIKPVYQMLYAGGSFRIPQSTGH